MYVNYMTLYIGEEYIVCLVPVGSMSVTGVMLSGEESYWYSALNIMLRGVALNSTYTCMHVNVYMYTMYE